MKFSNLFPLDCIELANKLIVDLELKKEPIINLIEIDAEFLWSVIKNIFRTDLLPKWNSLDYIDEIEEFQFILMILEQIFDIDLKDVNPAFLKLRKVNHLQFILNALYLAFNFIEFNKKKSYISNDLIRSIDTSSTEIHTDSRSSDQETTTKDEFSNDFVKDEKYKDEIEESLEEKSEMMNNKKDEIAKNEFERKKEIENHKRLIQNFTFMKERNFALELSYKIMDVIELQKKTKETKIDLKKLQTYGPHLIESSLNQSFIETTRSKKSSSIKKPAKKSASTNKIFKTKNLKRPIKKAPSFKLDLDQLINQLTGLTSKQIDELNSKTSHQKKFVDQIEIDLIEKERNLNDELLNRIDRENRILKILSAEMKFNLIKEMKTRDGLKGRQFKKAKDDWRREQIKLKFELDDCYRDNLSNYKHLENEKEKQLRELIRKNDELIRESSNDVRKEMRNYVMKKRDCQKLILDDYDDFYKSKMMLITNSLSKKKDKLNHFDRSDITDLNSRSVSRHLEQTFKSKLYPKFH